jgi:hypothetical protein
MACCWVGVQPYDPRRLLADFRRGPFLVLRANAPSLGFQRRKGVGFHTRLQQHPLLATHVQRFALNCRRDITDELGGISSTASIAL